MNKLDKKQNEILEAWKRGDKVRGYGLGMVGIESALIDSVSGDYADKIAEFALSCDMATLGLYLNKGLLLAARELAAAHLGYAYLDDCEEAMREQHE